jgi:CIC family chloride channel protein
MRMRIRPETVLLLLAFVIGVLTAGAAVGFHELIEVIRGVLYERISPGVLYGKWIFLLVLIPAGGGLAVGILTRYIIRIREGRGIIDVMESVSRTGGRIDPKVALERIVTAAITIGSGGSAGAEGPIVQIGAGIASGVGRLFRVARQHGPVLIGCGSAAGISAIFNAPIGGVLFTLEVILRDFSIRTFAPVVVASVIANFATQSIFQQVFHQPYAAIFTLPRMDIPIEFHFSQVWSFALLGVLCAIVGVCVTRLMHWMEVRFEKMRVPTAVKPAIGGAFLGGMGVIYIVALGWGLGKQKFIPWSLYSMPAFFGDGYGAVRPMLGPEFYHQFHWVFLLLVLGVLCVTKVVGTCLTLGSGGAGGIIAPSLFLGAVSGGMVGVLLTAGGIGGEPHAYALVGMGAVLAAVVHAPLAAMLITFEVTRDYQIVVPAMLACIIATSGARFLYQDSIYTMILRKRGVRLGAVADVMLLRRLMVEQVSLEPATVVRMDDPFMRIWEMITSSESKDYVVVDRQGVYAGMVTADEIKSALIDREAIPLLTVGELMRTDVPMVQSTDTLEAVLDVFARHDVARLPVDITGNEGKVIGLISRAGLMKRYQKELAEG